MLLSLQDSSASPRATSSPPSLTFPKGIFAMELQKLKPVHQAVARDLAMGIRLTDICSNRGLNYSSWGAIVSSELFKFEVKRLQQEIEDQIIDNHVNDPVRARLAAASHSAAERLIEEVNNFDPDSGAKSATRISAATTLLEINGYKKQEQKNVIVLNLSESKLNSISGLEQLQPQAESITGA